MLAAATAAGLAGCREATADPATAPAAPGRPTGATITVPPRRTDATAAPTGERTNPAARRRDTVGAPRPW